MRNLLCAFTMIAGVQYALAQPAPNQPEAQARDDRYQPEAQARVSATRAAAEDVREGNRLLAEGRYEEALSKYDAAEVRLPDAPEVAYNRGLALYRMGRYGEAESAFQDALKPGYPELEAKARYNLGRCAHASAMEQREDLPEAINELGRAIGFYNDALQLAPEDVDAQYNKEAAERLRDYLEKRLQAQPQPEQQEKDKDKKDDEDSEQEQDQDQQDQDPQPSDENQEPQDDDQDGEQDQEGTEDQESDQEGDSQEDQQGQSGADSEQGDRRGEPQPDASEAPSGEQEERKMTAEEAEPMLQEARDAERQRREALRQRMMRLRGRIPADKDW